MALLPASHPVIAQVINQGPGIWGNIATGLISGLLTGGIALTGIWLTHRLTLKREKLASENRLKKKQYFICTELVFLLERFAQACVDPAEEVSDLDDQGYITTLHDFPAFDYTTVTGDWRSLPDSLIYKLSEFPVKHEEASRRIRTTKTKMTSPREIIYGPLQTEASSLGLTALRLSRELRKLSRMPDDELAKYPWSAWTVLEGVYQRCMDSFIKEARIQLRSGTEDALASSTGPGVDTPRSGHNP